MTLSNKFYQILLHSVIELDDHNGVQLESYGFGHRTLNSYDQILLLLIFHFFILFYFILFYDNSV